MRVPRLARSLRVLVAASLLASCGGGGPPLAILNADMGRMRLGDEVEYVILFEGGCGGSYVLSLEDGDLPPGLALVDATHSLEGILEEEGEYEFELEISDRGCIRDRRFWETATAVFRLTVLPNPITVVGLRTDDRIEPLLPPGEAEHVFTVTPPAGPAIECPAVYNPVHPALPPAERATAVTLELECTGGLGGPYRMELFVDPDDPTDPLPDGVTIAEDSTVLTGTPSSLGPPLTIECEGDPYDVDGPFTLTFEIFDQSGRSGLWTGNWLIYEAASE